MGKLPCSFLLGWEPARADRANSIMTPAQKQFLDNASKMAETAGHIFPTMAACEAALESRYGSSALAVQDNNLFGMKQHTHPVYGTHVLPTQEYLDGRWTTVNANWVHYPTERECFMDRMATLQRLASVYPHYKAALEAKDAETFVTQVSQTWSTDPDRAEKVLDIHRAYLGA